MNRTEAIEAAARRLIDALDGNTEADGPRELRALRTALSAPPAPTDDKCWKCGGGVERMNTTLPGCDNDIFHDGQPPAAMPPAPTARDGVSPGDVVVACHRGAEHVGTVIDVSGGSNAIRVKHPTYGGAFSVVAMWPSSCLRPARPSERAAAGIDTPTPPPAPADEAAERNNKETTR